MHATTGGENYADVAARLNMLLETPRFTGADLRSAVIEVGQTARGGHAGMHAMRSMGILTQSPPQSHVHTRDSTLKQNPTWPASC